MNGINLWVHISGIPGSIHGERKKRTLKIVSGWLRKALQDARNHDYNELVIDYAGVNWSDLMFALVSNHPNYFTTAV